MESILVPIRRLFDVGSDGERPNSYTYTIWMLVQVESVPILIRIQLDVGSDGEHSSSYMHCWVFVQTEDIFFVICKLSKYELR